MLATTVAYLCTVLLVLYGPDDVDVGMTAPLIVDLVGMMLVAMHYGVI